MSLRHRSMDRKDIHKCVSLIARHPVIGPRYGPAIDQLGPAWLRLLGCEAMKTALFEEVRGNRAILCALGGSVFVTDDFVERLKTPPLVWCGPELAIRVTGGCSPVLADRQVADANSSCGLNVLVWTACVRPEFEERADVYHAMVSTFLNLHRGYRCKEAINAPAENAERLHWSITTGGLLWDPVCGRYVDSTENLEEIARKPHILGITRELELSRRGSWVGTLFSYQPPRCLFSRSEQQMLISALRGRTDSELAEALGISLPTIKKMWLSVYRRVAAGVPELLPDRCSGMSTELKRGKEKKRRILSYLREHPEELRPISRKLIQQRISSRIE